MTTQPERYDFKHGYEAALREFRELRERETRTDVSGRQFVLVPTLIESLNQPAEPPFSNALDRLLKVSYLSLSDRPPPVTLGDLDDYLRVFLILLDLGSPQLIHWFRERGQGDAALPIPRSDLQHLTKVSSDLPETFFRAQYCWCPIEFDLGMGRWYKDRIAPFVQKQRILPLRDEEVSTAGPDDVVLWQVDVPRELVSESLRKILGEFALEPDSASSRDLPPSSADSDQYSGPANGLPRPTSLKENQARICTFVVKQFPESRRNHFEQEKHAYRALKGVEGIVRQIGWYQNEEFSSKQVKENFFNIILETGNIDFYTAMRQLSPPVLKSEIAGFWRAMLDLSRTLAQIHRHVEVDGFRYDVWHGDIKPQNILRVGAEFKIADPGEARIHLSTAGDEASRAVVVGGTLTYAAPEKAAYLTGAIDKPAKVLQNSDIWSLGCVFSVAATWVVLGKQGVHQYDQLRRHADTATGSICDTFHDGTAILDVVRHWHDYLRESRRLTDHLTVQVLDMVEKHMLVVPAETRWNATDVSANLASLLVHDAQTIQGSPGPIETLLHTLDADTTWQTDSRLKPHSTWVHSRMDTAYRRPQSAEMVTGRRTASPVYLPSIGLRSPPETLNADTSSTASDPILDSRTTTPSTRRSPTLTYPSRPLSFTSARAQAPSHRIEASRTTKQDLQEPVTAWQLEEELREAKKPKISQSLRSFLGPSPSRRHRSALPGTKDVLEKYYKDRDVVFLVDNGLTMHDHWGEASHLIKVLVSRLRGYDDDGIDLHFTDPAAKIFEVKGGKDVSAFEDAMRRAKPRHPKAPGADTDIIPALVRAMHSLSSERLVSAQAKSRRVKRTTIIVLTDGIWKGTAHASDVDQVLKAQIETLRALYPDFTSRQSGSAVSAEQRPVSLQFIQFGHSPDGSERLRRLDDDLPKEGAPDIIDTEPSGGDVYKMLLGSISAEWDGAVNTVNSIKPSASGSTASPAGRSLILG